MIAAWLHQACEGALRMERDLEVLLAQVPDQIHEALELVGFTEYFHIFDPVASALEFAANLPAGKSTADAQPLS